MKRLRSKVSKRIMAVMLSVVMVMSNLTVAAAEDAGMQASTEVTSQVQESNVVSQSSASSEKEEASSEVSGSTEGSEQASTEEAPTEGSSTEGASTEDSSVNESSEVESEQEKTSEEETTEEETTEEETTEEETTEEETTEEETTEEVALMLLNAVIEADIYVAPNGEGDGLSAESPLDFLTALTQVQPGYSIKMQPGTYSFEEPIIISEDNAGRADAYKSVVAEGGEVIFDFSGMELLSSNRGITLDGSYWKFYGITIKGAGDNGMLLSGDNNVIEMCVFTENRDTGLQLSRYNTGYNSIDLWPSNNLIKNCTSFNNCDASGENADGFAAKLTCGEGNVFDGCMAYNNSDDGWDLYAKTETGPIGVVTIKNSIAFRNGKLTSGTGSAKGDMNGFKLGGSGVGTPHKLMNCIAFENGAHGFTDNNNPTAISLVNCTSFNNSVYESGKSNFQMSRENGGTNRNLLSYTTRAMATDAFIGTVQNSIYYNKDKGGFLSITDKTTFAGKEKLGTQMTLSNSDFISVTAPGTSTDFHTAWRNENGSIDTKGFLKVATDSELATMASDGTSLGAKLSGDTYMDVVPDEDDTDEKEEEEDDTIGTIGGTDTSLNISDMEQIGDITADTQAGDFLIMANTSKKVTIDGSQKSIDGFEFTKRLKLGGTGKTEYRNIKYTATDAATLTVYAMSSSGSSDRALALVDADGKTVGTQQALGASISKLTYEIPKAGTYHLYSLDSGINLYQISVVYPEVVAEPELPDVEPVESVEGKIDVWDFGAEQLDTEKYTNKLTEDMINNWYEGVAPGTEGVNIASFEVKDSKGNAVFAFQDGGYSTTHRLRSTNANITRYDSKDKTFGGVTYNGYLYSNKAANSDVYISVYAEAGDILTFAVSSNGTEAEYVLETPGKETQTQIYDAKEAGTLLTFYAKETGMYKLYTAKEKLVVMRTYVEHTQPVNVVGFVEAPEALTKEYAVTFTNTKTDAVTEAKVSNGAYTAVLNEGYTYQVALKNADGYVVTSADTLTLNVGDGGEEHYKQFNLTVGSVSLATVSGNVTGLSQEALEKLEIELTSDNIYVPTVTIKNGKYSAKLETGVTYTVEVSGVNDYELTTPETIQVLGDSEIELTFAEKTKYDVELKLEGISSQEAKKAQVIFANIDEEGYEYTFTGIEEIALRDGVYTVTVNVPGYTQKLTANLKVAGASVSKTIYFETTKSWDFSAADFTADTVAAGAYKGLQFSGNISKDKIYALAKAGAQIKVPVTENCLVNVSFCYKAAGSIGDVEFGTASNSTSTIETATYSYKGSGGYVTIDITGESYLTKIEITDKAEYQATLTVGSKGCDYTTISDALEAVRNMDRTDSQRVTIKIQPGNYEEMLVIDVANVTLENASKNPSTELKNKGVDIDDNAVRITAYYGHGYTYYSMGEDCKYSEELLTVNKENGYASFENPGSGTTNGSYWNATVVVDADGFEAEGIIFENSFNQYVSAKAANDIIVAQSSAKEPSSAPRAKLSQGSTAVQSKDYVERAAALAITNTRKQISFDNCKFIGRQDTLYGGTDVTAAFYDCAVYGGTDYIFGSMTAVFAKCDLVFNTSENKNDVGYITAAQTKSGRGLLMYNCNVTSTTPGVDTASAYTSKAGYLGRPWQSGTGEAVFYQTVIDATDRYWYEDSASLIQPAGWLNTLSGESVMSAEYGTYEMAKGVDNQSKRAAWASTLTEPVLADQTEISVEAFLGNWNAFAGKDMDIEMPTTKVDNSTPGSGEETVTSFVLDTTSDLPAIAAGTKADGDTQQAGTNDYFTIIYSEKTKVDSSSKAFEDDYTATQRINFGGKATLEKNAVKFTTNEKATVKIWWAAGDVGRQMFIMDASGTEVTATDVTVEKNATCISQLSLEEAGTYYLGGREGNNYIFRIEVTEEEVKEPVVSELDTTRDLPAIAAGTKADGDTQQAGTNDYFTIIYSEKTKVDSSSKTFEDDYAATQRINFGGKAALEKNAVKFTTNEKATVKIWWAAGDVNRQMFIMDASGAEVTATDVDLEKNATCISELTLEEAGTYYLGGREGNNYIFRIVVTEDGGSSEKPARGDWANVEAPEITSVVLDEEDETSILVTATAQVGYDGADKITVTMTDENGKVIASRNSSAEKTEHTVSFAPEASGIYTFAVKAIREGEADKEGKETKNFDFVLPLIAPNIKSATSIGGGSVEVEWDEVTEADSYLVTVTNTKIEQTVEELSTVIDDLTIGEEYEITVAAIRDKETSEASTITVKVTKDAQTKWAFAAFGQGVNTNDNGYSGNANEGSVQVYSNNGKGKIVPGSTDGLAFYYTEIDPETANFTLEATAKVNTWKLSNGQEGFGLMAADAVGTNGDSSVFWNNSYMASVTKVEYNWDGEKVSDSGSKISMKLGVGSQEKKGVTQDNITESLTLNDFSLFSSELTTLETSCAANGAGTYNIVGAYDKTVVPTGTIDNPITEFKLKIQKNNTGYFVSYTDLDGKTTTNKYYGTDTLNSLDADSVYVGFFASRNADITFEDISFTTIAPEDDAPAEERPITLVTPSYNIVSGSVANRAEYELIYKGNADGALVVKDSQGKEIIKEEKVEANSKISADVVLHYGNNSFTVNFIPDKDYKPSEFELLSSYEAKTFTFTVSYKAYGEAGDSIYVSADGKASGNGTRENPLDIYTAVKYVQPGQTIVITEGTYNLTKTVTVERGVNGTADQMIYMVADPEAASRPVFDFGGHCAGMVLAGDYWYFKGFDVTRSADAQKGIQVSGDYNTLDQINAYKNGNTGIQISRYLGTDEYEDWPSNNLILNCTSYENADKGYEDADGFAAKLTVGDGNVFDGCIAHHNADDGWDLFAKVQSGKIGKVVIKNSVAYKNGYVLDASGKEISAGNGNGFKMGGDSMSGYHELHNSIAFFNKAKGIDSNSCPDIQVYNSVSYNNESYNVAFYTNSAVNTDYKADGVISFRTEYLSQTENIKPKGTQNESKIYGTGNYYWDADTQASVNSDGTKAAKDWFESLNFTSISRNADGSINTNGFLVLTDKALSGGSIGGTPSGDVTVGDETSGNIQGNEGSGGDSGNTDSGSSGNDNSSSDDNSSSSAPVVTTRVTILDTPTPLAATAPVLPAGYSFEQVDVSKDGILKTELLNKYYGQKVYFAAIFGKDFGLTIDMQSASAITADMKLAYALVNIPEFAADFDAVHAVPNAITQIPTLVTLHFTVGAEYAGKVAYMYQLSADANSYEFVGSMNVSEIGNVAFETQNITDVIILISK